MDAITAVADVGDLIQAKLQDIRCHATHIDPHSRDIDPAAETIGEPWYRHEYYVLAQSTVDWALGVEKDLF